MSCTDEITTSIFISHWNQTSCGEDKSLLDQQLVLDDFHHLLSPFISPHLLLLTQIPRTDTPHPTHHFLSLCCCLSLPVVMPTSQEMALSWLRSAGQISWCLLSFWHVYKLNNVCCCCCFDGLTWFHSCTVKSVRMLWGKNFKYDIKCMNFRGSFTETWWL